ncbi:MAG: MMPL family transporter [Akkermansiaceae bacterium]|nr:MMPL family transporter [Akkermansiaceae bacterium]
MMRLAAWILGAALVVFAALGLGRLRMDPNVLGMLPSDLPEVAGLLAFHDGFARQDELVILLETKDAHDGIDEEGAAELARLLTDSGLVSHVRWRPDWMDDGPGMAELLAYLWLNGPPEPVERLSASLSPDAAPATFGQAVERVATAMEGMDLALEAHDPFGFLRHPSLGILMDSADGGGGEGFVSPDGTSRLLMARAAGDVSDYRAAAAWIEKLRPVVESWASGRSAETTVRFTGEPAFAAEIGGAMERDMRGTVGITMSFIGLLFWWMQRRLMLLAGLVGVLALSFVTTLGLGAWFLGELSLIAAGFAAILIGLVVDYGVLISQEAKAGADRAPTLRRATAPSILWAASTTAVVFFALNRSGLPGIAQLGTLVGIGMIAGALWMISLYIPFVARTGSGRPTALGSICPAAGRPVAVAAGASIAIACAVVLAAQGPPVIRFDASLMRPRDSSAMETFERLQASFPNGGLEAPRVIVAAGDDATMLQRLDTAKSRLAAHPALGRAELPLGWWPDAAAQAANAPALASLAADAGKLAALAGDAGFTDEGLALGRSVLDALARMTAATGRPVVPGSAAAREILGLFVSRQPQGGGYATGTLVPVERGAMPPLEEIRSVAGGGILLASWDFLEPAAVPLVRKDLTDVFLPMAGLMLFMLMLVFRRALPVAACIGVLVLTGLILLATMRALGISWNFLNIAAAPLLLGMGIDYGIHITLALRRENGDVRAMWRGTGKAVVFCGASTAIGFGSLIFASNEGMASLGAVAVIGILAAMAVSVVLLPGWLGCGKSTSLK